MSCERCQAMERELVALREKLAWAEGRRGQTGVCRARGFTPTETRILRKLAAVGMSDYFALIEADRKGWGLHVGPNQGQMCEEK